MSGHTKEPWSLFGVDQHIMGISYADAISRGVSHAQWSHNCSPEDARRIVACVNACAGVPNEVLEKFTVIDAITGFAQQRDELVAALKLAKSAIKGREHTGFIDEAIAKAEASK